MIESTYWRQELRAELAWLKKNRKYRRWSEKQLVLYERRLMLVGFQVRSLLERPKVNDCARRARMPVVRYKKIGSKPFTYVGAGFPEDQFDMESPEQAELGVLDVCNQLIHYYWMQTWSEGTAFKGMLVFSDFMRHKWAYQLLIEDLISLFSIFANESSAVTDVGFHWKEKEKDYVAQCAR
ncbi:hypothetical protein LL252_07565 [Alcanivorax marinus]|uniref:Uncharacterized protein n=1 Tax=Alloalcanivorax marinus TaxID=1177169 RepID=A0A9Q3YM47_9GAMM|nr:hypothetical protein [Alloalcanivorax marinus]MCC4308429.1 hypothetical protein [Alloalcanivorax marinus]